MFEEITRIELSDGGNYSRLFCDYVSPEGIAPFLPAIASQRAHVDQRVESGMEPLDPSASERWSAMIEEIAALSTRLGAEPGIVDKLALARSREARFVVTGQQPGVLGGPLYSLYKIATAVALAERLERELGVPCIPLYWCGADDADFAEVRGVSLIAGDLSVVSAALAPEAHRPGMPVGSIESTWLERAWRSLRPFTDAMPGGRAGAARIDFAFSEATDHGELATAVLLGLLGGCFAVVDGRSPAVRRCARSLFRRYVESEEAIKRDITRTGAELEDAGYHAQLGVGGDSGVFLVDNGVRHSVTPEQRKMLVDAVENRIEDCSPGVVLRNLVQDSVFEPLAAVLGPAEIAYRAQLGRVYDRFAIAKPLAFPRLAATFVPPPVDTLLSTPGGDARLLVNNPSGFAGAVYRAKTPPSLAAAAAEFDSDVKAALGRLAQRSQSAVTGKAQKKLRGRLSDLETRLEQLVSSVTEIGKNDALQSWPFLVGISDLIKPGDKPQERRIWSLVPLLFSNAEDEREVIRIATAHVDELMDGRWVHIVYSNRS